MKSIYYFLFVCLFCQINSAVFAQGTPQATDGRIVSVEDCASLPTDKVVIFTEGCKIYRIPKAADCPWRMIILVNRVAITNSVIVTTTNRPLSDFFQTTKINTPASGGFLGAPFRPASTNTIKRFTGLLNLSGQRVVRLMSDGKNWFDPYDNGLIYPND